MKKIKALNSEKSWQFRAFVSLISSKYFPLKRNAIKGKCPERLMISLYL
jgi:hypothetical protein